MPKKAPPKKSSFGADLIEGMKLVTMHQRGEIELEQLWPKPIDVKLSQGVSQLDRGLRQFADERTDV